MYDLGPPSVCVNNCLPFGLHSHSQSAKTCCCASRVCVALKITETAEQHICIKFCRKLGHSCSETYNMIQKAYGNKAMGLTQVKEWFKQFKAGWMSVESDECSSSLPTSRN